jgi:transcriptional regulator GlxA family with amidase domain
VSFRTDNRTASTNTEYNGNGLDCLKWVLVYRRRYSGEMTGSSKAWKLPGDVAPRVIGILGFDGVSALDFVGPLEAFKAACTYDNYHRTHSCYEIVILGLKTRSFVSDSGATFKAHKTIQAVSSFDTIVIPGGTGCRVAENNRIISAWLSKQEYRVRRFAAVCAGIYPFAETGLIDGRQVVTHWRFAPDVAKRFPKLHINQTASFLKDGVFYTCGGGTAAMEMTVAMINEDYGSRVALSVAREFVIRLRPPGSEGSFVRFPRSEQESTDRLADLPAWILAHVEDNLSVEVLAEKACLCPRHFSRVFKRVFKITPAEFVEQLRLGEARRRLLAPQVSIKDVADSVGFKSADAFRRAFERELGLTPSSFRARFQLGSRTPSVRRISKPKPGWTAKIEYPMNEPCHA